MLAEGKVRWAFWPPDTSLEAMDESHEADLGVWIPQGTEADFDISDSEHEAQPERDATDSADSEEDKVEESDDESEEEIESDEEGDEVDETRPLGSAGAGRFAALQLGAGEGNEDEDNEN